MRILPDHPFVVYYHLIDDLIFYIGSGHLSRAFDHGSQRRNEAWNEFVAGREVTVWVQGYYSLRATARRVEYAAIKAMRPVTNFPREPDEPLNWLRRPSVHRLMASAMKPYAGERIRVLPHGWTFETVVEAARATGVSSAAVCNSISGKYLMVGDYMFSREPIPSDCLFPFTCLDEEGQHSSAEEHRLKEFVRQIPSEGWRP